MKRYLSLMIFLTTFGFSSMAATPHGTRTLKLDTEASYIVFSGQKLKFKSGSFDVKKGTLTKGKLAISLQPFFEDDITFTLKKFTEVKTFAPGAPNALVEGELLVQGKSYPVERGVFYTPSDSGFEAKATVQNGKLKVDLFISAKADGIKGTVARE